MKNIIILLLLVPLFCQAQQLNFKNWKINTEFSIQKHDKRLFSSPDKGNFLALHPEKWGTYNYSVDIKRKVISLHRFGIYAGLGLNHEINTFLRPFDHSHFKKEDELLRILRFQDRYEKLQLYIPIQICYNIYKSFGINLIVKPTFDLHKSINNTTFTGSTFPYTESKFNFNAMELSLGVTYTFHDFLIGINARLFNRQKVDEIIFNDLIKYPKTGTNFESYNLLKLGISLGYQF